MKRFSYILLTVFSLVFTATALAGAHMDAKKDKDGKWVAPGKGDAKSDVILVVGATGQAGSLITTQLVGMGQNVRVLVRSAEKAKAILPPGVTIFIGDVTNPASLQPAIQGADYVISAVGAGGSKWDPISNPESVDYKGIVSLVDIAKANQVKQFVLLSSMGVTQPDHFLNKMMHNVLQWKLKGEDYLRASGLPYTIVRPGGLSKAPGGKQQIQFMQGDPKVTGWIPRADVAQVIINAIGNTAATNKTFEIISDKKSKDGQINWPAVWSGLKTD